MRIGTVFGVAFGVIFWLVVVGYLVFEDDHALPKVWFWPKFRSENVEMGKEEYIVERIRHSTEEGKYMKNGVYLTHHRYFLETIGNWQFEYANRKFTLNDICYKPHYNMIKSTNFEGRPSILQTLELEARHKSPCLIVTPLNCFYDSFKLHSDVSHWTTETEALNRRIRTLYIKEMTQNETKPYVKGNNTIEIIEGWSKLVSNLPVEKEWLEKLQKWVASLKPKPKVCADPQRTCEVVYDSQKYFNMCTIISNFNNETELGFELDDADIELMKTMDCVEDREKFIEWVKEKELLSMLDPFQGNMSLKSLNYETILNGSCNGIFGDGIEDSLFKTSYNGSFVFEIFLMTPSDLLNSLNHNNMINIEKTDWTLKDAEDIIDYWRNIIRNETEKINNRKMSKKLKIETKVTSQLPYPRLSHNNCFMLFLIIQFLSALALSSLFLWSSTIIYSTLTFILRTVFGFLIIFNYCADNDGFLTHGNQFLIHTGVLILLNGILTYWIGQKRVQSNKRKKNNDESSGSSTCVSMKSDVFEKWTPQEIVDHFDKYLQKESLRGQTKTNIEINPDTWVLFLLSCLFADSLIESLLLIAPSLIFYQIEKFIGARRNVNFESLTDRIKICRKGLVEEIEKREEEEGVAMVEIRNSETGSGSHHQSVSSIPSRKSNSSIDNKHLEPITKIKKFIRYYSAWFCYQLLFLSKKTASYVFFGSILFFVVSTLLLFWTPSLTSSSIGRKYSEDVFFDVNVENLRNNWGHFLNFEKEVGNYGRELTNWRNSFESYMKKHQLCISEGCRDLLSFEEFYISWYMEDAVSSSISARNGQPNLKVFTDFFNPSKFNFRLRYEIQPEHFENILHICDKFDILAFGNGPDFSVFQRNYMTRKSFVGKHLLNSMAIFIVGFICTTLLFNFKFGFLFTFYGIATKFEVEALIWILFNNSQEILNNNQLISNLALLFGLLIAWNPFNSLFSYQLRIKTELQREELTGREERKKSNLQVLKFADTAILLTTVICLWFVGTWSLFAVFEWSSALSTSFLCLFIIMISSYNTMTMLSKQPYFFETEVCETITKRLAANSRLKSRAFYAPRKPSLTKSFESSFFGEEVEFEDEDEDEEEVEVDSDDFDSNEEDSEEEILEMLRLQESRQAEQKKKIEVEKAEFLRNLVSSDQKLDKILENRKSMKERKERMLEYANNQPSCSSSNNELAPYFPNSFTDSMFDFMSDSAKNGGKPFVKPECPPPRAELARLDALAEEMSQIVERVGEMAEVGVPVEPVVVEVIQELSDDDEGFEGGDESD